MSRNREGRSYEILKSNKRRKVDDLEDSDDDEDFVRVGGPGFWPTYGDASDDDVLHPDDELPLDSENSYDSEDSDVLLGNRLGAGIVRMLGLPFGYQYPPRHGFPNRRKKHKTRKERRAESKKLLERMHNSWPDEFKNEKSIHYSDSSATNTNRANTSEAMDVDGEAALEAPALLPKVPELGLALCSDAESLQEGKDLFNEKKPQLVLARGVYITADFDTYFTTIRTSQSGDGRVVSARCSCSKGANQWCGHVVATLLFCFYKSEKVITELNVRKLVKELATNESLEDILIKLLFKFPARLYAELQRMQQQFQGVRKQDKGDEELHQPVEVLSMKEEWDDAIDKADSQRAIVSMTSLSKWATFIVKVFEEGQVRRAFDLAAQLMSKLMSSKQAIARPLEPYEYRNTDHFADRIHVLRNMWTTLLLFVRCPFTEIPPTLARKLAAIPNEYEDRLDKSTLDVDWTAGEIVAAMALAEKHSPGDDVNAPVIHEDPYNTKIRIQILSMLGRLKEAFFIAKCSPTYAPIAAQLIASGPMGGEVAIRELIKSQIGTTEAFKLAKRVADSDFVGAFLLARKGLEEKETDTIDLLKWLVREHIVGESDEAGAEARRGTSSLSLMSMSSRQVGAVLNEQEPNEIYDVLESIPRNVQRYLMLDILVDEISHFDRDPPPLTQKGDSTATDPYYIRSYYTSTSLTISFTDILKELADFLVRRDYVTQALDFLALACCRSFEYLPNLIKLAEAQGTPVLTKIMKWVLRHSRQGIPAGDALLWAERFQEQRLTDLALHMACFFIARAPSAAQRDVDWVFKLANSNKGALKVKDTLALLLGQTPDTVPRNKMVLWTVAKKAYEFNLYTEAFSVCLGLCSEGVPYPMLRHLHHHHHDYHDLLYLDELISGESKTQKPNSVEAEALPFLLDMLAKQVVENWRDELKKFVDNAIDKWYFSRLFELSKLLFQRDFIPEAVQVAKFVISLVGKVVVKPFNQSYAHNAHLDSDYYDEEGVRRDDVRFRAGRSPMAGVMLPSGDTTNQLYVCKTLLSHLIKDSEVAQAEKKERISTRGRKKQEETQPASKAVVIDSKEADLIQYAMIVEFLSEPSLERYKILDNTKFNSRSRSNTGALQWSEIKSNVLTHLPEAHQIHIDIALADGNFNAALQLVELPSDGYYDPQDIDSRLKLFGSLLERVIGDPALKKDDSIKKAVREKIEQYVWRSWTPRGSNYAYSDNSNTIVSADRTLRGIIELASPLIPKAKDLIEAHLSLADIRVMSIPAGRNHYFKLRTAIERVKAVCKEQNRIPQFLEGLDAIRVQQANRQLCLTILRDVEADVIGKQPDAPEPATPEKTEKAEKTPGRKKKNQKD